MIKSKENSAHYIWGNNCDSWILSDSENLVVKQELMPSKTSEAPHYHEKAQQFFYILSGEASFVLEGDLIVLKKGEGLTVSAMKRHQISNLGEHDLEFLVVSSSRTEEDRVLV